MIVDFAGKNSEDGRVEQWTVSQYLRARQIERLCGEPSPRVIRLGPGSTATSAPMGIPRGGTPSQSAAVFQDAARLRTPAASTDRSASSGGRVVFGFIRRGAGVERRAVDHWRDRRGEIDDDWSCRGGFACAGTLRL